MIRTPIPPFPTICCLVQPPIACGKRPLAIILKAVSLRFRAIRARQAGISHAMYRNSAFCATCTPPKALQSGAENISLRRREPERTFPRTCRRLMPPLHHPTALHHTLAPDRHPTHVFGSQRFRGRKFFGKKFEARKMSGQ